MRADYAVVMPYWWVGRWLLTLVLALGASWLEGCAARPNADAPRLSLNGKPLCCSVSMEEVQIAYLGSAGGGRGTLTYHGRHYPFTVAGLGVDGIGL